MTIHALNGQTTTGTPARRLREQIADGRLLRVAGAHDGLSARVAEEAGFDAVWASGLEISAAHGVPDISLLGLAEYLASAEVMRQSVAVPVVADCDTGFGGDLNAAYTTTRYESAGIAAVCFEDKVFPKRNSFVNGGQDLLDADEFARKIAAAKEAQTNPDMVVIARTETFICGLPTGEALQRCHLYVDAGADAVLVHSKAVDSGQVVSFTARWQRRAPVVVVPTTYSSFSVKEAEDAGIAMVIYANQGMRAAVSAMRETWATVLRDGMTEAIEPRIASVKEVFTLSGMDNWLGKEKA